MGGKVSVLAVDVKKVEDVEQLTCGGGGGSDAATSFVCRSMACNYVNICSELGQPEHAALLDGVDVLDGVDAEGSLFRYDAAVFCLSFMAKDALGRGLCVYIDM